MVALWYRRTRRSQGQVYYVDPLGSDVTGDGSAGNPWGSIVFAATQVAAGDTVLINPGVYDGGVIVETGGTAAEPITFQANGMASSSRAAAGIGMRSLSMERTMSS